MIKSDIKYLSDDTGLVEAPLTITGKASGNVVIVQQFLNLLLAPSDNLRLFGGDVLSLLKSTNNNEEHVVTTINYAAANTAAFLNQNGINILGATVSDITIDTDKVSVVMELTIDNQPVELSFQLPTEE